VKPRIIMVHGAFCAGWTFDRFRRPFEAEGYEVLSPPLPGHGDDAPPNAVSGKSMSDYAAAIVRLIGDEPIPPVLVGHSMGGLVCLMAAMKAEAAGLILLAPSAPWGIAGGTMEEAASATALIASGAYWAGAVEPDRFVARLYSLDRLPKEIASILSKRMRPESGKALSETLAWWVDPFMTTQISPSRIRLPVMAAVGARDQIHPPSTVRQTAALVRAELTVFPGMSHWLIGEPGWEVVAAACLEFVGGLVADTA
jgi:pimeloyl-ACP methyl ester carboxylesterase